MLSLKLSIKSLSLVYQSQSLRSSILLFIAVGVLPPLEPADRSSYSLLAPASQESRLVGRHGIDMSAQFGKCHKNHYKEEDAESPAVIKNPCHPLSMMKKHEKLTFTNTLSRRGSIGARASRARIFKQVQRSSSMGNSLSKPCKYVRIS